MSGIHPTAIISPAAELAEDVSVGPYTVIEGDVRIGPGTAIASSCLIASGARIGERCVIAHGAVIATQPQDLKFGGEKTFVEIGDGTLIREYATVNRGTAAHGTTTVGKGCMLMAYSHVAHDCILGDHVILANAVNLAGHVEIDDYVIIGGIVPVHQFVKIGAHAMIGGGFRVPQDVCPYSLCGGYPLRVMGINAVGLRRRGFTRDAVAAIEQAFKILFFSKLNTSQALERIRAEMEITPEVGRILEFADRSTRGLTK
ncbi:MAG TPA: acyl-ACP--UDP-N-acetylglucosamine O-acyltransferase [candidate division Zixibacteria bacterium]|nr:acyl-ACP--UDP-N-acetylglucosamine O-acyltransferase [candidate division Zixibacteria bacterium]